MAFETPILLIIFNRPSTTAKVFEVIRAVQPKHLYIVADGPRPGKPGEVELCKQARQIVTEVNWDCELKTLFREENIGCGIGVSQGISWFFEQVTEGIILEDDILADASFFTFCSEMLERYRNNERVTSISATNLMADKMPRDEKSYFFSSYGGNWGWATWRRSWNKFDYTINDWNKRKTHIRFIRYYGFNQYLFFKSLFDRVVNGKHKEVWDYQWWFCQLNNRGLAIIPSVNLMQNIGFGPEATHTFNTINPDLEVPVGAIDFPLKHPVAISMNKEYGQKIIAKFYSVKYSKRQKFKGLSKLFLD